MRPIFNIATGEDRHWWVVLYGSYWDYWVLRYFILINLIPPPLLPRPHYWIILANGKFYFTMASVGEDSDDWSWHSDWWISSIEISGDTQLSAIYPRPAKPANLDPLSPLILLNCGYIHSTLLSYHPSLRWDQIITQWVSIYGQIFWRVESWFWMIQN